jgi:hypothetical protein
MNIRKIKLINGPYNGQEIEDSGEVVIRMGISSDGETPGATIGDAIYEPNEDRALAFWNGNDWLGTLEEVIRA